MKKNNRRVWYCSNFWNVKMQTRSKQDLKNVDIKTLMLSDDFSDSSSASSWESSHQFSDFSDVDSCASFDTFSRYSYSVDSDM